MYINTFFKSNLNYINYLYICNYFLSVILDHEPLNEYKSVQNESLIHYKAPVIEDDLLEMFSRIYKCTREHMIKVS